MSGEEASKLLKGKHMQGWRDMVRATSVFLEARNIPWFSVHEPDFGPNHMGWSRIVSKNFKSKKFTTFRCQGHLTKLGILTRNDGVSKV